MGKSYDKILSSSSIIRQIPRLLWSQLDRMGQFPLTGLYSKPIVKHYGLMVQHLRYKWRKVIVDFLETNWKDKFVIAYHVQMGNKNNNCAAFNCKTK